MTNISVITSRLFSLRADFQIRRIDALYAGINTAKACRTTVYRLNYRLLLCLTMPGRIIHEYFLISLWHLRSVFFWWEKGACASKCFFWWGLIGSAPVFWAWGTMGHEKKKKERKKKAFGIRHHGPVPRRAASVSFVGMCPKTITGPPADCGAWRRYASASGASRARCGA